ncbi:MAG: hypothetical protein V3U76_15795 [Granulosicoccus sp.]
MKKTTRLQAAGCCVSAIGLLLGTSNVQASTCGELSPRFEALGDDYFNFDIEPVGVKTNPANAHLEQNNENRLSVGAMRSLLDNLGRAKFRSGEGERTTCRGSGANTHEVTWQFNLEDIQRVKTLNGEIRIAAWEDRHTLIAPERTRRTAGSIHSEVMSVPNPEKWVINEDMTALIVNQRQRKAGAIGSYISELKLTARTKGKSIELQQVFYINGQCSDWVTWRLDT